MKIPVLSRLLNPRASPQNTLYGSAYSFFFGGTASGKTDLARHSKEDSLWPKKEPTEAARQLS